MDANIAIIIVATLNMIAAITAATLTYYTNRRTKRLEQTQQQIAHGVSRIGNRDDFTKPPDAIKLPTHPVPRGVR